VMGLCMAKLDNTFTLSGRADFQFQLFRQLTGGKVNPHCDSLAPQDGTRRIASVLIYVNDDYEGGELTFDGLEHPFTIKPSPGMVIAYPILNEWNEHDPTFRHSAAEVTKGEKIMGYFSLRG
ncbi:MAG: 2OG-Fe(II) oxygenase, partial [Alphaproteobacteria bacterium]